MRRNVFWVSLLAVVLTPFLVQAQGGRYVKIAAQFTTSRLYYEARTLPAEQGQTLLVTSFRIPNDLLVFMKNQDQTPGKEYISEVNMTVEVYRDREKVVEDVWFGVHYASTYEQTTSRDLDVEGALTFELPPGSYGYRLRIDDKNSDREAVLPLRRIQVPDFGTMGLGRALIARSVTEGAENVEVDLANLGGDALYGEPALAALAITVPEGVAMEDVNLSYELRKLNEDDLERESRKRMREMQRLAREREREAQPLVFEPEWTLEGGEVVEEAKPKLALMPIAPATEADVQPGKLLLVKPKQAGQAFLVVIDLEGATLGDGTYVLDVEATTGGEKVASQTRFNTHWRNMPISLNDPDVAIENLEFMTDKKTVREMRRGSRAEKIERFQAFWKERDPTPDTEYNELMEEYYRRVDHAAFEFRTGAEPVPDGLRTDRAEVYILNGPPDSVNRDFPNGGGVREVWTYDVGKTFVFEAASSVDDFRIIDR